MAVGVLDDSTNEDGVSVLEYGMYNEFGTDRIPARPFMSTTYARYADELVTFVDKMVDRIVENKTDPETVLKTIGEWYTSKIKLTIRDAKNWAVPNSLYTIAIKGSSSPLIDNGRLVNSINYEVD